MKNKKEKITRLLILTATTFLLVSTTTAQTQPNDQAKQMLEKRADRALKLIQFLGFLIAAPFGSYQGYKYITSEHDPSKRKEAKNRLGQILVGLAIIEVFPLVIQWIF